MTVPARYILAAIAFAIAALGLVLLPTGAAAECNAPRTESTVIGATTMDGGVGQSIY